MPISNTNKAVFCDAHSDPLRSEMPISNTNKAVFKQETESIIKEITDFHMLMYGAVYTHILYEGINSHFTLSATCCSMISCYYFSGILQVHPRPLKSCKYLCCYHPCRSFRQYNGI